MEDLPSCDPTNGCGEALGLTARDLDQASQESACCRAVPMLAQHRVEEIPVPVDGPVEVAPAAADLHVGLVQILGAPATTSALRTQLLADHWREAILPAADGLMTDLVAALHEELCDVTEAELVA